MTVAEAVKISRSGGLFSRSLIAYGQSQLRESEDLVCAAVVYVTRQAAISPGAKPGYLARAEASSKIKMLLCVTTRRLVFFNHAFGSALTYELPMSASPVLDSSRSKNGYGVGSLRLTCGGDSYFIAANRKLTNHLKSGILAAMMIYRDKLCGAES